MKKILSKLFDPLTNLFGRGGARFSGDNPLTIEDGSENATRRQLVQVLLSDVLRRSGIPAHWIDCQLMLVSSRTRGSGLYMRLVIRHWDERLLHYALAFQNELTRDITRFEPRAASWLHGVSWQLDVADTYPYAGLPDKTFWRDAEQELPTHFAEGAAGAAMQATFQVTQPFRESGTNEDLERLFAIRDRELAKSSSEGLMPVGYEKTQPSPL